IGAQYIIIGHSERRTYHKESDELIAKKFAVLKEQGLTPVLCIRSDDVPLDIMKETPVISLSPDSDSGTAGDNITRDNQPTFIIG
ncbi:triose-phosphate isomerase, partial [Salmonella enterica subsp. enterica serovar Lubbock]|nr:triose-phosphate isomerase [Salmonella enterica subsp. enterica serovar Lubbock]